MAKQGLRLIDLPDIPSTGAGGRVARLDARAVRILNLFVQLHAIHGRDAVIKAYAVDGADAGEYGWFVVRGVLAADGRTPKRSYVDWADPRRRTEHMAHLGLLDWVDKGAAHKAGFRLNDDGRDFMAGLATVKERSIYRNRRIVKREGKCITITDVKDTLGDREQTGVDGE